MKRSLLHSFHEVYGAKFVEFYGWELPLSYLTGTLSEHWACRNDVAVFDVSHLGRVRLKNARQYLQWRLTNDIEKLKPMTAQYTHILEEDASVIDDLICVDLGEDEYLLVINAANYQRVCKEIDMKPEVIEEDIAFLAVQGPEAPKCLKEVLGKADAIIPKNTVGLKTYKGQEFLMLGTGYTGEIGVECLLPSSIAEEFARDLVEAGAVLAGLGARDLLRLEAGYPLHGQELGSGITPLQAQLGWVVAWKKEDFCGRSALEAEKKSGVKQLLWGIKIPAERKPLRAGSEIHIEGKHVGKVTSGNFSPTLECAIGMGFISTSIPNPEAVEITEGKSIRQAQVCKLTDLLVS